MKLRFLSYRLLLICALLALNNVNLFAQANPVNDIIQINGITMTADSLRAVPDVTVVVKGKNRGVESSYTGVFSIVCYKGDTLQFSCLGFRPKEYAIPKTINSQISSLILLMVQDTFYLPETIVRPLPSREEFNFAFTHWHIPGDQYELARRNTDAYIMRTLAYTTPRDGHESQSRLLQQQAREAVYYGQRPPMNIFNPIAWGQFFEAWKRGDFRRESNPYVNNY